MLDAVLDIYLPNIFMASAERTGAAIFKDELNLTKNKIVGLVSQLEKDKAQQITPAALFDAVYKRGYALPVDDNVRFVVHPVNAYFEFNRPEHNWFHATP